MNEDFLKEVAAQLRKPNGEFGREVADKMNESNQQMNLKTIELLDIKPQETILEVGMANGAYTQTILEKAASVKYIGIDYSSDMVELALRNNNTHLENKGAEFFLGDIINLPVSSNSVDKLFTVNTIYFWGDLDKSLLEGHRVLKTNGLFAITIRPEGCLRKYPSTKYNFKHFSTEDIENLFIKHGFEIHTSIHEIEPETEVLDEMITPEFAVIVGKKLH